MKWREIPSLTALRAFEATARHNSFSKAARELNVTHAAIAQHVRALEAHFAQGLVYRSGRNMELTDAGTQLATSLNDGFETIADGVKALQDRVSERPLNVALTPSFAENWVMPRISDFWAKHPEVELSLLPSQRLVDMQRDGIDLAIRFGRGDWPGHDIEWLTTSNYVIVAAPGLLADKMPTRFSELSQYPWVLEGVRSEALLWAQNHGVHLENAKVTTFNTNQLVLAAARAGLGLAIQGEISVEPELEQGKLISVMRAPADDLGYYLMTRRGHNSPNLMKFKKWLLQVAKTVT